MRETSSAAPAPRPIPEIAGKLELGADAVEPFGWYAGKFAPDLLRRLDGRPRGRYVGVTATSPTPLGEGKTVVSIGLAMALARRGQRSIVTLRQPSLAPVFGIKGGGAGGGRATLLPTHDINLHFTGDLHAVAAASNLLAAMLDNHSARRIEPIVDPDRITWRRVIDISDKGLAHIETGLDQPPQAPRRATGFDLTAASEVMSVLALATDLQDLRLRLGRIVVARPSRGEYVTAEQIGAAGAMAALLKNALRPNLVQTCEQTPAIVHAGPFANISHGNSSVIADQLALRLADYVVTESGFGADLGAEKLFHIKCRSSGLRPDAEVLVCTLRGIKFHSGRFLVRPGRPLPEELVRPDTDALRAGAVNLAAHLSILRTFRIPTVVAINRFPTDTDVELSLTQDLALAAGADRVAVVSTFSEGSEGALDLADAVVSACQGPNHFEYLYPDDATFEEKIECVAARVYGAAGVDFHPGVRQLLGEFAERGYARLPVCIAKTQYSLSHDPALRGRPRNFRLPIREVRLAAGAGFVLALTDGVSLMPGLPRQPAARAIDLSADGSISGLGS